MASASPPSLWPHTQYWPAGRSHGHPHERQGCRPVSGPRGPRPRDTPEGRGGRAPTESALFPRARVQPLQLRRQPVPTVPTPCAQMPPGGHLGRVRLSKDSFWGKPIDLSAHPSVSTCYMSGTGGCWQGQMGEAALGSGPCFTEHLDNPVSEAAPHVHQHGLITVSKVTTVH